MSVFSRHAVLALGFAGLVADIVISHPAFAVNKVTLFKVVTPQKQIVIGLTRAELAQMQGKTADAVAKTLQATGELQAWQYETVAGVGGEAEETPVGRISVSADPATRIEAYATSHKVAPVTDTVMIDALR